MNLNWTKRPGSMADMCKVTGGNLYATAPIEGGQVRLWVNRYLKGAKGRRHYVYIREAVKERDSE